MVSDGGASSDLVIRRAREEEVGALGELAMRSKAHWGYDAAFMEACREDLAVSADDIASGLVHVIEDGGQVVGFSHLRGDEDEAELVALFVEPGAIGGGYGKRLWRHAEETARGLGYRLLRLQSEPHAEGFYRAMGATRVGESASTVIPERMLPLMRYALDGEDGSDSGSGARGR